MPRGVEWGERGGHARPGNVTATRYAQQVRGILIDRLDSVTAEKGRLAAVANHFGLSPELTGELLYFLMLVLFPEDMRDEEAESKIAELRGARAGLVPDTLERAGEPQLRAYLEDLERKKGEGAERLARRLARK